MPLQKKELDYLNILKAISQLPFNVGKKLMIDFLQGNPDNESVKRNRLDRLDTFGSLSYSESELHAMLDNLIINNMVQLASYSQNKYCKVLSITDSGRQELKNPTLHKKKLAFSFKSKSTIITEDDKKLFSAFDFFLSPYNTEQKKAIIDSHSHILCIAGAGSGKTTVLTKRIEFLINFRSINPQNILAITFTRKARQEMQSRLSGIDTHIETFNSFCEKILKTNNSIVYDKPVRVITYSDKIKAINQALSYLNTNMQRAISAYFSDSQKRAKTDEQLANIFMSDCFFVRDYFKSKNMQLNESTFPDLKDKGSAMLVYGVCKFIDAYMKKHGLRDYTDQLIDTIGLFKNRKDLIPEFEHIMIDEYQDVNSTQIELISLLNPKSLFCVGDPRQAIYGWRGSDVKYILNFEDRHPDCEIITLTKNYRSTKHIVNLINHSIKTMNMPDLESCADGDKDIKLLNFDTEFSEFEFVIQKIIGTNIALGDIFVLARTNRQLTELSEMLHRQGIAHTIRSDELRSAGSTEQPYGLTLATIHSIKGLEAKMVFVIGCTNVNFPCKASEHPVIEMFKVDEYDKEEEERRLLYVAMSRAKESLYLSYSGKGLTPFCSPALKNHLDEVSIVLDTSPNNNPNRLSKSANSGKGNTFEKLKSWRTELSRAYSIAPYMILQDRTIEEIVQNMPIQEEDLENIYGLGPAKIKKYGKEIIRIVNGY